MSQHTLFIFIAIDFNKNVLFAKYLASFREEFHDFYVDFYNFLESF